VIAVKNKIFDIIADELTIDRSRLSEQSHFYYDLGCSMDALEIFMRCEEEFEIDISDVEYSEIETTADLIRCVEAKLREKPLWPSNLGL
jgi:acyl carrier protein